MPQVASNHPPGGGSDVDEAISDLLALHNYQSSSARGHHPVPHRPANSQLSRGTSLEIGTSTGLTRHFSFLPIEARARRKSTLGPALGRPIAGADGGIDSSRSMSCTFSQSPYMALVLAGAPATQSLNPWRPEPHPNQQHSHMRGRAHRQSAVCHQSASTATAAGGSLSSTAHAYAGHCSVGGVSIGDGSVSGVGRTGGAGGVDSSLGGFLQPMQLSRVASSGWNGSTAGSVIGGEISSGLSSPNLLRSTVNAAAGNTRGPQAAMTSSSVGGGGAGGGGVCMRTVSFTARGSLPGLLIHSYPHGVSTIPVCGLGVDASGGIWAHVATHCQPPHPARAPQCHIQRPHSNQRTLLPPHPPPACDRSSGLGRGSIHCLQLCDSSTPLRSSRQHPSNASGFAALGGQIFMVRASTGGGTVGSSPSPPCTAAPLPPSPARIVTPAATAGGEATAAVALASGSGGGGRGILGRGLTEVSVGRNSDAPYIATASRGVNCRGGDGSLPRPSVGPFSSLNAVSGPDLASQLAVSQPRSFSGANAFLKLTAAAPGQAGLIGFEGPNAGVGRGGGGGGEHSRPSHSTAAGGGGGLSFSGRSSTAAAAEPFIDASFPSRNVDPTDAAASRPATKAIQFRPFSCGGGVSMRAFHLAWSCLFLAFVSYFSPAAMLPVLVKDLRLSKPVVAGAGALSLMAGLMARLLMGVWVRRYGPRYCQAFTLLLTAPAVACMSLVDSAAGLIAARIAIAFGLGAFVSSSVWLTLMFHPSVLGAATMACTSLGNVGSGLAMILMPLLYQLMLKLHGGDVRSAWHAVFYWPAGAQLVLVALTLLLGQDTPHGDLMDWDWEGRGLDDSGSWIGGSSTHSTSAYGGSCHRRDTKHQQEQKQQMGETQQTQHRHQGCGGSSGAGVNASSGRGCCRGLGCNSGSQRLSWGGQEREAQQGRDPEPVEDASVWGQKVYLQRLRAGSASLRGWGRTTSLGRRSTGGGGAAGAQVVLEVAAGAGAGVTTAGSGSVGAAARAFLHLGETAAAAVGPAVVAAAVTVDLAVPGSTAGARTGSPTCSGRVRQAVAEATEPAEREREGDGAREAMLVGRPASRSVDFGSADVQSRLAAVATAVTSLEVCLGEISAAVTPPSTTARKQSASLDDEGNAYQQWRRTRMRQQRALGAGWREALHLYGVAFRNYRCLLLALNYGYNFGAQMALYNVLTLHLVQRYGMRFLAAGGLAAMPGLLNVLFRPSGSFLSGLMCRHFGMRGRLWLLCVSQMAGGLFCLLLGQCGGGRSGLAVTSVLLLLFALASQVASGTSLTIAPYVSFRAYFAVLGITSAGGQLGGALLLAFFFMSNNLSYQEGLRWMGFTILAMSTSLVLLHFPMWGGMLSGPSKRYGGVQEEQYYLAEWTVKEQQCGAAAHAMAFARQARSERRGWDQGKHRSAASCWL